MRTITTSRTRRIKQGAVALTLLLGAPAWAQVMAPAPGLSGTRNNEGARAMLYWRLPLDGARSQTAQYGVRLDTAALRIGGQMRSLPLVDVAFGAQRTTVKTLGVLTFDSSDLDLSMDSLKNPWVLLGIGAGVVAISCATGHFPCKDEKNDSGTYTTPGASR